jgi:hypothetical protein
MKPTGGFTLALASVVCCGNPTSSSSLYQDQAGIPSAGSAPSPMATGSGNTIVAGTLRTFSFTARHAADGSAQGAAQINNRFVEEMFQVDIDCLEVFANLAIMSGIITRHTDTTAIGLPGIFAVRDVGEGSGSPPDSITQVVFLPRGAPLTCHDVTPTDVEGFMAPIVGGSVQVH